MIFTSNRVNDFKVPLGLQKHDKLCVVMDFFFFPTFFIGLPKENLITFGSLPVLTSAGSGTRNWIFGFQESVEKLICGKLKKAILHFLSNFWHI